MGGDRGRQAPRGASRPARGSCGRWRPGGRRPTRRACRSGCRSAARRCRPRRSRRPTARRAPGGGRDRARGRDEPAAGGVLGVEAALRAWPRRTTGGGCRPCRGHPARWRWPRRPLVGGPPSPRAPPEAERLRRHPDLLGHEVEAGDHLGHRMLDLEPGVHLQEPEHSGGHPRAPGFPVLAGVGVSPGSPGPGCPPTPRGRGCPPTHTGTRPCRPRRSRPPRPPAPPPRPSPGGSRRGTPVPAPPRSASGGGAGSSSPARPARRSCRGCRRRPASRCGGAR